MALLEFPAAPVAKIIATAQASTSFILKWNRPVFEPKLILVIKQGVYLMPNGCDIGPGGKPAANINDADPPSHHVYATGFNPTSDCDWDILRERTFRDHASATYLDNMVDIQVMIHRGDESVRLSLCAHVVKLYDAQVHGWAVHDVAHVPSGLGGVFQVEILEITARQALVQNVGNCEDFDDMPPYCVHVDQLRALPQRRAA